jgi:hypothetical protein
MDCMDCTEVGVCGRLLVTTEVGLLGTPHQGAGTKLLAGLLGTPHQGAGAKLVAGVLGTPHHGAGAKLVAGVLGTPHQSAGVLDTADFRKARLGTAIIGVMSLFWGCGCIVPAWEPFLNDDAALTVISVPCRGHSYKSTGLHCCAAIKRGRALNLA